MSVQFMPVHNTLEDDPVCEPSEEEKTAFFAEACKCGCEERIASLERSLDKLASVVDTMLETQVIQSKRITNLSVTQR